MTRTLSAIGLSALTSTLTASAFLLALHDYREAVSLREHTLLVIHALDGVLTAVQAASTSRGTYLLTEDQSALVPYPDACKRALQRLQEVQDLTADNPSRQERAQRLGELVRAKVQEMEKTRFGAYSALFQQVKSLHEETGRLANAFRAPPQRGRWAELHLRRAVELAGLSDHCDFYEQVTVTAEGSAMRPDMVIKLAGGRTVLVDAKAPFAAYVEAGEATDDATRVARLRDHAAQVRQHVTLLSRKSYWEHFDESAELIILYLPSDALFVAALDHDRELLESALRQRVVLATPSTLLALLLTVAHGWKQEKMEMNAREIANLGRDLHKRISDSAKHLAKLGKHIDGTVRAYNEAVGSLEARVLPGARRFKELQAANVDVEIEPLVQLESAPRRLTAPELAEREVPEDAN